MVGEQVTGFNVFKELLTDAEIREVFDTINSAGNGLITKKEISFYLDFLRIEVTEEDLVEMIKLCDCDLEDHVDFPSFESMVKSVYPLAHNNMPTKDIRMRRQAIETSARDGKLSSMILTENQESKSKLIAALSEPGPKSTRVLSPPKPTSKFARKI
jgi:hypothetical protein